jgi:uncharacterized RDD family membrane protein YckC
MAQMSQVEHEVRYEDLPPLPYAGFGLRLVAAMLDMIVLASVFFLFVSGAAFYLLTQTDWGNADDITDPEMITAASIVSIFAIFVPLYFFSLWWARGQTLGQMATRIAVTDRDGYHISGWRALLRTITWPLSILPIGIGLAPIFFDQERRALHDMLSGTVVIELP